MDKAVTIIISWTLRSLPHAMVHHVSDFWKPWRTSSAYTSAHDFLGRTCLVLYKFGTKWQPVWAALDQGGSRRGDLKKILLIVFPQVFGAWTLGANHIGHFRLHTLRAIMTPDVCTYCFLDASECGESWRGV